MMNRTEYQRQYRERNRNKLREIARVRYAENKQNFSEKQKAYYNSHKEQFKERRRKYYESHKAMLIAANKSYISDHPEVQKRSLENYKTKYPERIRDSKKKYQDAHKAEMLHRVRKRRAILNSARTDKAAANFYRLVKSRKWIRCYYCSTRFLAALAHIDHIVALSKGGNHASENLCVACPKCNRQKSSKSVTEWKTFGQTLLAI